MAIASDIISDHKFGPQLCEALGLSAEYVRRIIIDVEVDAPVCVFVEMFGSTKLLHLDWVDGLKGAHIATLDKDG